MDLEDAENNLENMEFLANYSDMVDKLLLLSGLEQSDISAIKSFSQKEQLVDSYLKKELKKKAIRQKLTDGCPYRDNMFADLFDDSEKENNEKDKPIKPDNIFKVE